MWTYLAKLEAACIRHQEGASWREVAERTGIGDRTLRQWDTEQEPEWAKACEEAIAEMRRRGVGVAYRALVGAAEAGDVAAAKALLDRGEGSVTQKAEVSGANGGAIRVVTTQEVLSNADAIAAACALERALSAGDADTGGSGEDAEPE